MESGGFVTRFPNRHFLFILFARLQDINRGPPIPFGDLCKTPGMTFSTGEVTTRLVDGEVIFWTGEMNRRDQPEEAAIRPFQSGFTGEGFSLLDFYKTTPLRVSLLD